jgi:hypothetical protein
LFRLGEVILPELLGDGDQARHGRLRVVAVITEREPVRRILAHLGEPTDAPPLARARDPTDDPDDVEPPGQLVLGLG